jgi:putative two-component system response regulator
LVLIEHVLSDYPNTAVIMVTGVDDPQTVEKALEIGAYGYIVKPFQTSEVMINISSALRRRSLELWNRIYRESLEQMVIKLVQCSSAMVGRFHLSPASLIKKFSRISS